MRFTIDHRQVDVGNWLFSSKANGGYDSFSGSVPSWIVRKYDSIAQEATVRAYTSSGFLAWEGTMDVDPNVSEGLAQISAKGPCYEIEQRTERLLYQSYDTGLWTIEGASPINASSSANVQAQVVDGAFVFTVPAGVAIANGDAAAIVCYQEGAKVRRYRANIFTGGTTTNWSLKLERFTGPSGSRTSVNSSIALGSGTIDESPSPAENAIALSLVSGAAHTRTNVLTVRLSGNRVNDKITTDVADAAQIAADVGRRMGYDTTGIPIGAGTDSLGFEYVYIPAAPSILLLAPIGIGDPSVPEQQARSRAGITLTIPIAASAANVLPIDWNASWSSLLDYLASLVDWRWRVSANAGQGSRLEFGPWSGNWKVSTERNAFSRLRKQPIKNISVVKYQDEAGVPAEYVQVADPNPLAHHPKVRRPTITTLQDRQPNQDLAKVVAQAELDRYAQPRWAGTVECVGARDIRGERDPYEIPAGDIVDVEDKTLRISSTEMSERGVTLGIEAPASGVIAMLARKEGFDTRRDAANWT